MKKERNMETQLVERLDRIEAHLSDLRLTSRETFDLTSAAAYLHISKSHLYQLTSRGKIGHYKPAGKRIYFDRADLDEYIRRNRVDPAA